MADSFVYLDQDLIGLQEAISQTMRKKAPKGKTGDLKRSIKPQPIIDTPQGLQAPIKYISYGKYPDFGTKYQSAQMFTEKSQEEELAKQQSAIGEAAGKDVLNMLDLPNEINVTLDV